MSILHRDGSGRGAVALLASARSPLRGLGRDATVLLAVLAVGNASSYVFHLIMARMLGPAEYGALSALLGIMVVLGVPAGAVQAVVARRVTLLCRGGQTLGPTLRSMLRPALVGAIALSGLITLITPWSARFLQMNVGTVLILAPLAGLHLLGPVWRGALQGQMRLFHLGGVLAGGMLLRLAAASLFVGAGLGLPGAVFGLLVAEAISVVVSFLAVGEALRASPEAGTTPLRGLLGEAGRASLGLLAFWLLVSVDVILARHYLSPGDAGRYAAAALVGRAILFLPAGVEAAAYPRFAGAGRASRSALGWSLGAVMGLGVVASLAVAVFPGVWTIALGPGYQSAASVAPVLALAMTGFGVVSIFLYHRMAHGRAPLGRLWSAVVLEVAALVAVHNSPLSVAVVVLATAWALAASLCPFRNLALWVRSPTATKKHSIREPVDDQGAGRRGGPPKVSSAGMGKPMQVRGESRPMPRGASRPSSEGYLPAESETVKPPKPSGR